MRYDTELGVQKRSGGAPGRALLRPAACVENGPRQNQGDCVKGFGGLRRGKAGEKCGAAAAKMRKRSERSGARKAAGGYGGAAACACAENGAMVRVLRSQAAMKVGVQRFNVLGWSGSYWPSAATAALTAAPVELYTLTVAVTGGSTQGVGRSGSTIRVFCGDGGRVCNGHRIHPRRAGGVRPRGDELDRGTE